MKYESQYYGIQDLGSSDYLAHYGVIGMKWGIRKYQNPDGSLTAKGKKRYRTTGKGKYKYKSHSTKKYDRKLKEVAWQLKNEKDAKKRAKLEAKQKEYEKRATISRELDRREQQYASKHSVAGNLVSRAVTSPYGITPFGGGVGSKSYQQWLSMMNGQDKKGITGKKVGAWALSNIGARPLSTFGKAVYIRDDSVYESLQKRKKKKTNG